MSFVRNATATFMCVLVAAACGDDPTGPSLGELAGSYTARSFVYTAVDGSGSLDVIGQGGGSFSVTIQDSGAFVAELGLPGAPAIPLTGTITLLDSNTLSVGFDGTTEARLAQLAQAGVTISEFDADFVLQGDTFTWTVTGVDFDIDQDGTEVPANLQVVLEEQ